MWNFCGTFRPGSNLLQLFLFLHHLPREIFAYNCFIGHQLRLQPRAGSICEFLTNQKAFIFLFFFCKEAEGIDFISFSLVLSGGSEICHHLIRSGLLEPLVPWRLHVFL